MKKNLILAAAAAIIALSSCGHSPKALVVPENLFDSELDSLEQQYAPALVRGDAAPLFTSKDTSGVDVNLSDFSGKIIVLDFWASWCGDCKRELPGLKALYEEYKDEEIAGYPVQFFSLSMDNDPEAWKSTIKSEGMAWPQASDLVKWKESAVSEAYQLHWLPTFYVIGPDGKIIAGCITSARIGEILNNLKES